MEKIKLSDEAKRIWGKLSHNGSSEWLPLYIHLEDAKEIAILLWDKWLPIHTKQIIIDGIELRKDNYCKNNKDSGKVNLSDYHNMDYAKKLAVFLAMVHDIGKASPNFQDKANKVGYGELLSYILQSKLKISFVDDDTTRTLTHAVISEAIMENGGIDESIASVIGGHHGKPVNEKEIISLANTYKSATGINCSGWGDVQKELLKFAIIESGVENIAEIKISSQVQIILNGFLIMTDWIASGDGFHMISTEGAQLGLLSDEDSKKRAEKVWKDLNLPLYENFADACSLQDIYEKRFAIKSPRNMQIAAVTAISKAKDPGIVVIEAPMGEGKTEAALAVAEILALKKHLGGLFFALPTQATSDGIFKRIKNWIEKLHEDTNHSIFLAHGKAGFNEDYSGIKLGSNIYNYESGQNKTISENVVINDWTQGKKKGLLSDFVVGTVDQILMCGLKMKHLALRHLGIANKVVIVDECHAYDAYMSSYLDLVLSWLGSYNVPVIILSATLPPNRRKMLVEAYLIGKRKSRTVNTDAEDFFTLLSNKRNTNILAPNKIVDNTKPEKDTYPLITYTENVDIKEVEPEASKEVKEVKLELLEKGFTQKLAEVLKDGGCVGIIKNTVKEAQATAECLRKVYPENEVKLIHSRFISCDRVSKELEIRALLGPVNEVPEDKRPNRLIVIGTQVLEQSLDVDFDIMFTDICPMDLLLQRIGRLHRHNNRKKTRPPEMKVPTCYVMGVKKLGDYDSGSTAVYGEYLLFKTHLLLPKKVIIPEDIPILVRKTYDEKNDNEIIAEKKDEDNYLQLKEQFEKDKKEQEKRIKDKQAKAKTFQINKPQNMTQSLIGWLRTETQEDATGRKGEATVRDTENSLEVLVVQKRQDGYIYTLPWLGKDGGKRLDFNSYMSLGKKIAGCRVSLPGNLVNKWQIDKVIQELETVVLSNKLQCYYDCSWLDGELFLVLDENLKADLAGKKLRYDENYGLESI